MKYLEEFLYVVFLFSVVGLTLLFSGCHSDDDLLNIDSANGCAFRSETEYLLVHTDLYHNQPSMTLVFDAYNDEVVSSYTSPPNSATPEPYTTYFNAEIVEADYPNYIIAFYEGPVAETINDGQGVMPLLDIYDVTVSCHGARFTSRSGDIRSINLFFERQTIYSGLYE